MPGRLGRNFRQGHLAEDVGIELLRHICAVASVRQEDDIGIDGVATILHTDGALLRAGRSFSIQLKAQSVDTITYDRPSIDWFLSQQVPLLFGRVDLSGQTLALYTTSPARPELLREEGISEVRFEFAEASSPLSNRLSGNTLHVPLGPPVVLIDRPGLSDDARCAEIVELLDEWVRFEAETLSLSSINVTRVPTWSTGSRPESFFTSSSGGHDTHIEDLAAALPYIEKLVQRVFFAEASERYEVALAYILLAEWYRDQGLDVDFDEQMDWRVAWPDRQRVIGGARPPWDPERRTSN